MLVVYVIVANRESMDVQRARKVGQSLAIDITILLRCGKVLKAVYLD